MTGYSDPDIDALVATLHRLRARRHDITAVIGVALCEASDRCGGRDALLGQWWDVEESIHIDNLMKPRSRWTRQALTQAQVQAGIEARGSADVTICELALELDLPEDVVREGATAEEARGAASQTSTSTFRMEF